MHPLSLFAIRVMIVLFAASIVFHVLVLAGFVPIAIVWGGRYTNPEEIYHLELFSLTLNGLLLLFSLSNRGLLIRPLPYLLNKILLAIFGLLFLLNTVGNLMAKTKIERFVFTPVTAVLFVCFGLLFFAKKTPAT